MTPSSSAAARVFGGCGVAADLLPVERWRVRQEFEQTIRSLNGAAGRSITRSVPAPYRVADTDRVLLLPTTSTGRDANPDQ